MERSAWTEEGLSSGDTTGPSSAMAAMAAAVIPDGADLGKRARGMNGGKAEMLARSARGGDEPGGAAMERSAGGLGGTVLEQLESEEESQEAREVREGEAGVLGRPHFDGRGAGHAAAASRGSGTRGSHGELSSSAWSPRRQIIEHVVGAEESKVGRRFGLALGRIRPRTKNKV
jgi:hypothetical protein